MPGHRSTNLFEICRHFERLRADTAVRDGDQLAGQGHGWCQTVGHSAGRGRGSLPAILDFPENPHHGQIPLQRSRNTSNSVSKGVHGRSCAALRQQAVDTLPADHSGSILRTGAEAANDRCAPSGDPHGWRSRVQQPDRPAVRLGAG
jgi:hypothetical protein